MNESKQDTPHRIRADANIKYAVSLYPDLCGHGLHRATQIPEMSRRNPAEVDENNVSRLLRALEVGPRPTRAL